MTSHLRPLLTLPLALGLLACDGQTEAEHGFRSQSDVVSEAMTLQYDADLPPVAITSIELSGSAAEAFGAAGADMVLEAAGELSLDDGFIAVTLDGVQPLGSIPDGLITLRQHSEANDAPIAASRFGISIDGVQIASTRVVFEAPADVDGDDFLVWQDSLGTSPAAPAPVQIIEYELVDADGNSTVCTADVASLETSIQIDYRPVGDARAHLSVTIAPDCIEVLEEAAKSRPAEAFFVRCDPTTTTAAKIPGMHKVSDVTLKRGVIHATGEPVGDVQAP